MIRPIGVHVLVEPIEEESVMIKPEQSKGSAERGIIRGIGSQVEDESLKEGDMVIFRKYSPEEFRHEDKMVYLVEQQDLMGVIYEQT